jgi:hypothetical protein
MAQTAYILGGFGAHILDEIGAVQRIDAARIDAVLPDQDAVAVAEVVEVLLFVEATAPDAACLVWPGVADQLFERSARPAVALQPRREGVGRDPVRSLGKDRHAVDDKGEGVAPLVSFLAQLDSAQAKLKMPRIDAHTGLLQQHLDRIERLRAVAVGPPDLRIVDRQRQRDMAALHRLDHFAQGT